MKKLIVFAAFAICAQPALAQQPAEAAATSPAPPSYAEVSAATAPIADAYFAAYTGRDWDTLEPLLAEEASFADPTATHIFGPVLSEGREAMMERFRVGYASISHMEFITNRRLVSGGNAIYEGALHWGIDLGGGNIVDSVMPMVIVLTVEDGQITSHRDYADYAPFVAAVSAAQAKAAE